jgi:Amt family ammonium transporter
MFLFSLFRHKLFSPCIFLLTPGSVFAEAELPSAEAINVIWLAMASAMVFLMQAGFALVESGMSRSKNAINVIMKNYLDVCMGSIIFWMLGFGLMFGLNESGLIGTTGFFLHDAASWDYSFLLFQTMFAATAVTIASGAMAERTKFGSYLVAAVVVTGFIYPIFGSWAWGGYLGGKGWLAEKGFIDFAGSTVVHSVGGWCALAAIVILGPRLGRFDSHGAARNIPGHNVSYVALGGFILWFGWFGFNGGSTVGANVDIGLINLNTQLAACAGACGVMALSACLMRPILVGTIVNGSLAGLVGITAGCATMEPVFAIITGFTAGIIAQLANDGLLKLGIDDVVGAVGVHGFAGAWGTLCAGMFLTGNLFDVFVIGVQLLGIISCFAWVFFVSLVLYGTIHLIIGLRSSSLHEQRGLDFSEHAEIGYPEFMQASAYTKETLSSIDKR